MCCHFAGSCIGLLYCVCLFLPIFVSTFRSFPQEIFAVLIHPPLRLDLLKLLVLFFNFLLLVSKLLPQTLYVFVMLLFFRVLAHLHSLHVCIVLFEFVLLFSNSSSHLFVICQKLPIELWVVLSTFMRIQLFEFEWLIVVVRLRIDGQGQLFLSLLLCRLFHFRHL